MEHQGKEFDEIDLREYIDVLWRGKWVIAAITLCAMVTAGLISFFALDPVYESTVVLAASLPEEARADVGDPVILGIIGGTPQAHIRFLKDPAVLERAAQTLATRDIRVGARALGGKTTVRAVGDPAKGDKLLEVTARDKVPENSRIMADTIAEEYVNFLSGLVSARLSSRRQQVGMELAQREARLAEAAKRLGDLVARVGEANLVRKDIEAKTILLAEYEREHARNTVEAKAAAESVRSLESHLQTIPELVLVRRSTGETAEEVNPAYPLLITDLAQKKATLADLQERSKAERSVIAALGAEIEALEAGLVENAIEEQNLRDALSRAQMSYLECVRELEVLERNDAETIVRSAVHQVAPAATPTEPSGPRRLLNVAIAGVLGAMVSVLVVLVKHYWYGGGYRQAKTAGQAPY